MGICPKKFGPFFWGALHLAALGGPAPSGFKKFVESYPLVLPCEMCREHFAAVLQAFPFPEDGGPKELFKWTVDLHNAVNTDMGKSKMTYEQALNNLIAQCNKPAPAPASQGPWLLIATILTLIILMLVLK